MTKKLRTYEEINQKIKNGDVTVITADEMTKFVENEGVEVAAKEIDVVTTGTFGAMCSSGAFLNFGHSDPPIKMEHVWLNDVHCYHGNAAVDVYVGATRRSDTNIEYGGGHVIEALVAKKEITLRATAYATDCYPRTRVESNLTIDDLNQAILCNPRNGYQRYNAATNSRDDTLYTYMGKLLPKFGNVTFAGSGCLSPLYNDPNYETIGMGTRIFLGGGIGYIIGEGTQHNPKNQFGTIMVKGDLKQMRSEFLKGANFQNYGTTLYIGIGIPIPILNEGLAKKTSISDKEIKTSVIDYGVPRRDRPSLKTINYEELKSGKIELNGRNVKVSPLTGLKKSKKVAEILKSWIEEGKFFLTAPVETLPTNTVFKPMKLTKEIPFVRSIMGPATVCKINDSIESVAKKIIEKNVNHIIVVDDAHKLQGIVTSFDITKAVAQNNLTLADVITRKVITTTCDEPAAAAARKLETHEISALPVIDTKRKVLGMVTAEGLMRLLGKRRV
ncbi:MAG: homocysteine biosynthesis protein [Candidatus Helarchaeota archaeon]